MKHNVNSFLKKGIMLGRMMYRRTCFYSKPVPSLPEFGLFVPAVQTEPFYTASFAQITRAVSCMHLRYKRGLGFSTDVLRPEAFAFPHATFVVQHDVFA